MSVANTRVKLVREITNYNILVLKTAAIASCNICKYCSVYCMDFFILLPNKLIQVSLAKLLVAIFDALYLPNHYITLTRVN